MRNESHINYLRRATADEAELWAANRIEELERENNELAARIGKELNEENLALQAEIAELVAALESARAMIGHPDNIAIIDEALAKVRKP